MIKRLKLAKKTLSSLTPLIPLIVAVLSSAVTFLVASNVWTTLVAHPEFEILPSQDLSSINMTNIGQTAAHQVKITLATQGNHTDFLGFSNENATWQRSYDSTRNQTIIAANLQRLAVKAKVVIRFVRLPQTVEIWISSNERGDYLRAVKGQASTGSFWEWLEGFLISSGIYIGLLITWIGVVAFLWRRKHAFRFF